MKKHQALLALVFVAFLLFRLPHIRESPRWYWDEGINLDYSKNLLEGHVRWNCLDYAWIPHPPAYYMMLAGLIKLFGYSMYPARILSVLMGAATTYLLYITGKKISGTRLGLMAACAYTIYPAANYWGRMAFNNNLLALLITLATYFFIRHIDGPRKWWRLCMLTMGVAAITQLPAIPLLIALIGYSLIRGENRILDALIFGIGPSIAVYIPTYLSKPVVFTADLTFQLHRFHLLEPKILSGIILLPAAYAYRKKIWGIMYQTLESESKIMFDLEWIVLKTRYVPLALIVIHAFLAHTLILPIDENKLFAGGDYFWMGLVGILFMNPYYMNTVVFLLFLPLFITLILLGRSDHMLMTIYPFFALGTAILIDFLERYVKSNLPAKMVKYRKAGYIVLFLPFIILGLNNFMFFAFADMSKTSIKDMRQAAGYVNSHTSEGDIVLATSHVIRYLEPENYLFPQAVVRKNCNIMTYVPDYMPETRFTGECRLESAAYMIMMEGNHKWVTEKNCSQVNPVLEDYRKVSEFGVYEVYVNTAVKEDVEIP